MWGVDKFVSEGTITLLHAREWMIVAASS